MPIPNPHDKAFMSGQYHTASNLNARISLHQRFSTNPYGWQRWVFDRLILPSAADILELGCGPADLWRENLYRLPGEWNILLTDMSAGMLEQARFHLESLAHFRFDRLDLGAALPLENETFDAVIANHMLYHVADKNQAFTEIHRVLRPGGMFFATTVGAQHLIQMQELVCKYDPSLTGWNQVTASFTLENGVSQMERYFQDASLERYEDSLLVTDPAPLADYLLSGWISLLPEEEPAFRNFIARELTAGGGALLITKDSGLFTAHK